MGLYFFAVKTNHHNHASHFLFPIPSITLKATAFSLANLGQVLWGSRVCLSTRTSGRQCFRRSTRWELLDLFIHPFIWQIVIKDSYAPGTILGFGDRAVTKTSSLLSWTDKNMRTINISGKNKCYGEEQNKGNRWFFLWRAQKISEFC